MLGISEVGNSYISRLGIRGFGKPQNQVVRVVNLGIPKCTLWEFGCVGVPYSHVGHSVMCQFQFSTVFGFGNLKAELSLGHFGSLGFPSSQFRNVGIRGFLHVR